MLCGSSFNLHMNPYRVAPHVGCELQSLHGHEWKPQNTEVSRIPGRLSARPRKPHYVCSKLFYIPLVCVCVTIISLYIWTKFRWWGLGGPSHLVVVTTKYMQYYKHENCIIYISNKNEIILWILSNLIFKIMSFEQ